eukprot:COSAG01_NODE_643_length_14566_cov_31.994194_7_plen_124_part_00
MTLDFCQLLRRDVLQLAACMTSAGAEPAGGPAACVAAAVWPWCVRCDASRICLLHACCVLDLVCMLLAATLLAALSTLPVPVLASNSCMQREDGCFGFRCTAVPVHDCTAVPVLVYTCVRTIR